MLQSRVTFLQDYKVLFPQPNAEQQMITQRLCFRSGVIQCVVPYQKPNVQNLIHFSVSHFVSEACQPLKPAHWHWYQCTSRCAFACLKLGGAECDPVSFSFHISQILYCFGV